VKKPGVYLEGLQSVGKTPYTLAGIDIKMDKVFPPYRYGWVKFMRDGKEVNQSHEFHYFPIDERDSIPSGDESIKARKDEDKKELREKVKNRETGETSFVRVKEKLDGTWFKTFKKTFDVRLQLANPQNFPHYKFPDTGVDTDYVQVRLGSSKIKDMLENLTEETVGINLIPGKDKAGKPAMVRPFDWEDSLATKLEGVYFRFRTTGTGMDTRYVYKNTAPFTTKAEAEAVFGDAPAAAPAKESKPRAGEPTQSDVDSLPF
jgi:hypothetical protein